MKARPRSVENQVASYLNTIFTPLGLTPVERIPILGREGPDITINESGLVIDVKSRIEVPRTLFFPVACPFLFCDLLCVPLKYFPQLLSGEGPIAPFNFSSVIVQEYWSHMDEWTQREQPDGISCVILHRPREPIGSCVAVIHQKDHRRLIEKCQIK